jgi:release factor glutamine methyltransferase
MDWFTAQKELTGRLAPLYGEREAAIIADWVMEALTGKKKLDRLMMRTVVLTDAESAVYERYSMELLAHRPVQYVLGEAWFAGMSFFVDERVLIPRPETEELVEWVEAEAMGPGTLLDVGTGSGCIPVAIAKKRCDLRVMACDISVGALAVAQENAEELGAPVGFLRVDFLDRGSWDQLPAVRWLVSNPPYIPFGERAAMATHVIDYEPGDALFVPDNDPLVFYRALGEFGRDRLGSGGGLFAEIHEELGPAVRQLLMGLGAREVILRKDLQGRDRMIKATW